MQIIMFIKPAHKRNNRLVPTPWDALVIHGLNQWDPYVRM